MSEDPLDQILYDVEVFFGLESRKRLGVAHTMADAITMARNAVNIPPQNRFLEITIKMIPRAETVPPMPNPALGTQATLNGGELVSD